MNEEKVKQSFFTPTEFYESRLQKTHTKTQTTILFLICLKYDTELECV